MPVGPTTWNDGSGASVLIRFYDIEWDREGHCTALPKEVVLPVDDDCEVALEGANLLTDRFGYCLHGFEFEPVAPVYIGSVSVIPGAPEDGNPWRELYRNPPNSLAGPERLCALRRFHDGEPTPDCTFWYTPYAGGATRQIFDRAEINWENTRFGSLRAAATGTD